MRYPIDRFANKKSRRPDARPPANAALLAPCEEVWSNAQLVPAKRAASLIFSHASFEKILLFLEVDDLAHPRKRIGRTWKLFG